MAKMDRVRFDDFKALLVGKKVISPEQKLLQIMNHPAIKQFKAEHPDIPDELYRKSIPLLDQYIKDQNNCSNCTALDGCKNMQTGHTSELVGYECSIDRKLKKCHRQLTYEEMIRFDQLLQSHKVNPNILKATFDSLEQDESRGEAIYEAFSYCEQFENGLPDYGLYLYGSYGVGKSYIAGAIANYLIRLGIDCFMAYMPDLVVEINASIDNKTTHKLVEVFKRVKVLILDDIGAENLSQWSRDEIFGAILNERVANGLPTIYTSNKTLDELKNHLSNTRKGGYEPDRAARIMERIENYAKPIKIVGKNRRKRNW